jgi:uncharacterized damage-inducible protein DinB
MKVSELATNEYSSFNATYIQAIHQSVDLIHGLEESEDKIASFLETIPLEKLEYRYADGKWTIKDIIQHIIDAERIFCYRALRISRNDKTALTGFDENEYVENTNANLRDWNDLLTELKLVRRSTVLFFKSISIEQLLRMGTASNHSVSVRAIGFVILGHQQHHFKIITERYL